MTKMIFEHEETGLQICVSRVNKYETYTSAAGVKIDVLVSFHLETESGQKVVPDHIHMGTDTIELIKIYTGNNRVQKLIRVK